MSCHLLQNEIQLLSSHNDDSVDSVRSWLQSSLWPLRWTLLCDSVFMAWVWARGGPWWGWRGRRRPGHRPPQSLSLWGKSPAGPVGWRYHNCSSAYPTAAAGCYTAPSPANAAVCAATPTWRVGRQWLQQRVRKGRTDPQRAGWCWGRERVAICWLCNVLHTPGGGGARTHLESGWGSEQRGSTCRFQPNVQAHGRYSEFWPHSANI